MGKINICGIKLYANHGCLEEEGKIGSVYKVDVTAKTKLDKPANSDKLSDTVDYMLLNKIVKEEMAIRSSLLEHVAERILNRMLLENPKIDKVKVKISKINPPIGGNVSKVCIEMSKKKKRSKG